MKYTIALVAVLLICLPLFSQQPTMPDTTYYQAAFEKIDSLLGQRLNQDALKRVDEVLAHARDKGDEAYHVKALSYKMRLQAPLMEESDSANLALLEAEIARAKAPLRNLLQSLRGEYLWQYYQQNRWRINERTRLDKPSGDFREWDNATLAQVATRAFLASVDPAVALQNTPISRYDILLEKGYENDRYRPTLYDFLAHRALDYLSNTENLLDEPAYAFQIDAEIAFAPAAEFVAAQFETPDTASRALAAAGLYQDILRFHLESENTYALVDADLKRLDWAKETATGVNKDDLYRKTLIRLRRTHRDHPVSTQISFRLAREAINRAQEWSPSNPQQGLRTGYIQAKEICEDAIARFPQSEGAKQCRNLLIQIHQKELSATIEEAYPIDQPMLVQLQFRNLERIHLRVVRITPRLERLLSNRRNREPNEIPRAFAGEIPVEAWSLNLPQTDDFQGHLSEFAVPAAEAGRYGLLISDDSEFTTDSHAVALAVFQVTDLAYYSQPNESGARFFVRDRASGEPLEDVKVELFYRDYRNDKEKKLGRAISDEAGIAEVKFNPEENPNYYPVLSARTDEFRGDPAYAYYYRERPEPEVTDVRFFLDRTIYRPGQTVYFKGIAITKKDRQTYEVAKNKTFTVRLLDANGEEVSRQRFTSNQYGSFQGTYTAPQSGLTGVMRLVTDRGQIGFRVEEYKRPKFKVEIEPIEGDFRLGETVEVTGNAVAYAGNVIDGAEVRYRVVREARFPYWYRFWWMPQPSSPRREIVQGTTQTDPEGKFSVEFELTPDETLDPAQKPIFSYTVYADVIDVTGETRSGQSRVRAGYVGLTLSASVPDRISRDAPPEIKVTAQNLAGKSQEVKGKITISRLGAPDKVLVARKWQAPDLYLLDSVAFKKMFPHLPYRTENDPRSWSVEDEVVAEDYVTESDEDFSLNQLRRAEPGVYRFRFETTDAYGNELEVVRNFVLYDSDEKRPPTPDLLFVEKLPENDRIEPGETRTYSLRTSVKRLYVTYQLVQRGEILAERQLELRNKRRTEIEIPIEEAYRGGVSVSFAYIYADRFHEHAENIAVPWTNKELKLSWETFRSPLKPGAEEQWRLHISGSARDAVAAELVATLYDASLDALAPQNNFSLNLYPNFGRSIAWSASGFGSNGAMLFSESWNERGQGVRMHGYDRLRYSLYHRGRDAYFEVLESRMVGVASPRSAQEDAEMAFSAAPAPNVAAKAGEMSRDEAAAEARGADVGNATDETDGASELEAVPLRTNLNETAFFFPQLQTDESGDVVLNFTMPEALTTWRFIAFAHTTDLQVGTLEDEVVTQKELMVQPNLPRFLRRGDRIVLTAKVANLTENELTGQADLELVDAATMQSVDQAFGLPVLQKRQAFSVAGKQSTGLRWEVNVPLDAPGALLVRVRARSGEFADGEENLLPVLTNRVLVTETLPLPVRGDQAVSFKFEKLLNSGQSSSLQHQQLSLEFTANPAWYAVQSLPYLMEYPHECSEQIFSRIYANGLASHVANQHPRVQRVFEQWRTQAETRDRNALLSALMQNEDLKSVLLSETPWVVEAQSESERKQRLGLLFDLNRMRNELAQSRFKLFQQQNSDGGWPWFPGFRSSTYITTYIAEGFGHLQKMGVALAADPEVSGKLERAVRYVDGEMNARYREMKRREGFDPKKNYLSYDIVHYLYMRSFYPDLPVVDGAQEAYDFYYAQAREFWPTQNIYAEGMIALTMHRGRDPQVADRVLEGIRQNAITNPELGTYWKENRGWFWWEAEIERQALLIEAFDEAGEDKEIVEDMKVWLLKNKQTNHWRTTRATVSACNALLSTGADWLAETPEVNITLGGERVEAESVEAGTGYFRTNWQRAEISPEQGNVTVQKSGKGVAWGALYWQYFEDMDKVTYAATPLRLTRALFREEMTPAGPQLVAVDETELEPGDKLVVRLTLRSDRAMTYLHLRDQRASGLEPINVLSQSKYQDGLWYYESTRDATTDFFIEQLPANQVFVFEYPLRVVHRGDFSTGIGTIQCMYAPEFTSHSEGRRLKVKGD